MRDAYCIARPSYGFLSVRLSVSRKVCPRRRAVSLRQLSFLFFLLAKTNDSRNGFQSEFFWCSRKKLHPIAGLSKLLQLKGQHALAKACSFLQTRNLCLCNCWSVKHIYVMMPACICVYICIPGWLDDVELVCDIVGDWFGDCLLRRVAIYATRQCALWPCR